jgi:hypothetical protein
MTMIALSLLFASAGLFAIYAIVLAAYRHGPAALRLRQALGSPRVDTVVRFTMRDLRVARAPAARILRPDFAGRAEVIRPGPAPLRAAA